jgi:hypothetical protein
MPNIVVDWVNGELRSRARTIRAVVRQHLADCGVPDDQLFELDDDTNGSGLNGGGEIASLVASGTATGYGTSIRGVHNTSSTGSEWDTLAARARTSSTTMDSKSSDSSSKNKSKKGTSWGDDEFASLDSLAVDLCDLAIRKG